MAGRSGIQKETRYSSAEEISAGMLNALAENLVMKKGFLGGKGRNQSCYGFFHAVITGEKEHIL